MMASDGMLSLSWNKHKTTFCHILSTLREQERYTDVTLACEGKFYPVHKLVLSTCSEYFEKMFDNTPCKHPVVVLNDIKCSDIEALISYMYAGVVSVLQQDMARILKTAELLQIKGLAVPDEPPVRETPKKNLYQLSSRDNQSTPHSKRRREENSMPNHPIVQAVESPPSSLPHHQDVNKSWEHNKSLDQRGDDSADQRQNYGTDHATECNSTRQQVAHSQGALDCSLGDKPDITGMQDWAPSFSPPTTTLPSHISHTTQKTFPCPHCPFQVADVYRIKDHIRIHNGEKPFACAHCPYRATRKSNLKRHINSHHSIQVDRTELSKA